MSFFQLNQPRFRVVVTGLVWVSFFVLLITEIAVAERPFFLRGIDDTETKINESLAAKIANFLWQSDKSDSRHVWPEMKFGWRIVLGSIIGFFGAALGSVGGVGGGGIFVPMLTLIIGFDAKSSTAISKCMIMGAAVSTVFYNWRLRHPTLDLPIIDYDLALLFQPMLMLGISIGVVCNVIFADWMVTVLLIILFLGTSTKAFFKGIETWKKETIMKKEAAKLFQASKLNADGEESDYKDLPSGPAVYGGSKFSTEREEVTLLENVYWKEFALLVLVWVAFLAVQVIKTYATTCSTEYWVLNILQVPIALSVTLYEAVSLYKGRRIISSTGEQATNWRIHQLFLYCCCGILAGIVGGLLGLGGGFILGPLFLELGVPPQVASATSTFAMAFSSSMSVIQYYLLKRFPIPYAVYFAAVATVAAVTGQHVVRKLVMLLGRASLIIFILALTIFVLLPHNPSKVSVFVIVSLVKMQAGKNTASSAKEKVANTGDSAKAGMDKTKATVQGQMEKMTPHNPVEKEMAQKRKDDKIQEAEINKEEARVEHAVLKEQTRFDGGVAGQPTGAGVMSGLVGVHPIGVNTGTGTGTNYCA